MTDRALIKTAAVALLDTLGKPHPLGHQSSKARRYVLSVPGGAPLEVMFEQNPESPPNLWVLASAVAGLTGRPSPAAKLRSEIGKDGQPNYGRHSALEKMPQLGEADLLCLAPSSLAELGQILDQLVAASARGGI